MTRHSSIKLAVFSLLTAPALASGAVVGAGYVVHHQREHVSLESGSQLVGDVQESRIVVLGTGFRCLDLTDSHGVYSRVCVQEDMR